MLEECATDSLASDAFDDVKIVQPCALVLSPREFCLVLDCV